MINVKVINTVNAGLNRLAKNIVGNSVDSVEDATMFAAMKWKELVPKGTGRTASNIYKVVEKKKGSVEGKVVSPANIKGKNFYLNVFLEKGASKGSTNTTVKGNPYRLRSGYFGAAELTSEGTEKHFKTLVEVKVDTSVRAFNK